MSDAGKRTVLQMKYARIIPLIAEMGHMSNEDAMRVFYDSELFPLIDEGVADLHCRSDKYLAGEILASEKQECTGFHKEQ